MNREQILALAPDQASITAAKTLCNAKAWLLLGASGQAIWGECKGSGAKPYQTRIDFNGNACKCSCPSRKFPCKHGLALYLLYVDEPQHFAQSAGEPPWVTEWLASRHQKTEAKTTKATSKPVDAKAKEKRQQQRDGDMSQGLQELGLWLEDSVRMGFAEFPAKPLRYWDGLAARMVDAKLPGLAVRIRKLGALLLQKGDNLALFAEEIARLHLLVKAYPQRGQLPAETVADINQLLGLPLREEEVLALPAVHDEWSVLGNRYSEDNALITRETWLLGTRTRRFAKVLNFVHSSQRQLLQDQWIIGNRLDGAIHYYPSATPLRAVIGGHQPQLFAAPAAPPEFPTPLADYGHLRTRNPWLTSYPLIFPESTPLWQDASPYLRLADGGVIPLDGRGAPIWKLLALSGGLPVTVFGEWDGHQLQALGVWHGQGYANVMARTLP